MAVACHSTVAVPDDGCLYTVHPAQSTEKEHPYVTAVYAASRYIVERVERPWYMLDAVYRNTAHGRRTYATIRTLHGKSTKPKMRVKREPRRH